MSDHDPLCPISRRPENVTLICECWWIAQARADERERIAQAIEVRKHPYPGATNIIRVEDAARIARENHNNVNN